MIFPSLSFAAAAEPCLFQAPSAWETKRNYSEPSELRCSDDKPGQDWPGELSLLPPGRSLTAVFSVCSDEWDWFFSQVHTKAKGNPILQQRKLKQLLQRRWLHVSRLSGKLCNLHPWQYSIFIWIRHWNKFGSLWRWSCFEWTDRLETSGSPSYSMTTWFH